jgi:S1-C subfamily serine protease
VRRPLNHNNGPINRLHTTPVTDDLTLCKIAAMKMDTPTKELLFSTVRIVNEAPIGVTVGTGFLMQKSVGDSRSIPLIVTNKHVLANADRLKLGFIARSQATDQPALGRRCDHVISSPDGQWTGHPDPEVDVAVLPIGPIISQLGSQIFGDRHQQRRCPARATACLSMLSKR